MATKYRIIHMVFLKLGLVFFMLLAIGCTGKEKPVAKQAVTSVAVEKQSDFFIDSTAVTTFLKTIKVTDSVKSQAYLFYKQRNFRFAWASASGFKISATNFYTQIHNDSKFFGDDNLINSLLDSLIINAKTSGSSSFNSALNAQPLELLATTTFLKYALKMYGGISQQSKNLEWHIPRKPKNYIEFLNALSASAGEIPKEPVSTQYSQLKKVLVRYQQLQVQGGFPVINSQRLTFAVGDTNACLVQVKAHLLLTGDMAVKDTSSVFDSTLAKALMHYQARMGLTKNGKLNSATLAQLNKPIGIYIKQILVNLERLRWLPATMESSFLLVNIPEYKLHVVADGKQLWATNVVVGKAAKRTTIFKDDVSEIILNPYWNVPSSLSLIHI
jgi:murein L,D-transpeptidase YcbB/YkuD